MKLEGGEGARHAPLHSRCVEAVSTALNRDSNMEALQTLCDLRLTCTNMIPRGVLVLGLLCVAVFADPIPQPSDSLEDCFKKDSISCVQVQLFRNAKSFFDQENIDIFGGLSLVKNPKDKTARALEEPSENEVTAAKDADERENLLESYAVGKVKNFFQERSLSWNLSPVVSEVAATARSLANNIPPEIKEGVTEFITEGRGKKKKLMKALLPLLIGLKLKLAAFAGLAYIVIALIAKKALLASLVSLAISGFIGIRKLLSQQHHAPVHHEVVQAHPVEYSSHGGGWSGGGASAGGYGGGGGAGGGGWESYGGGHGDAHGSYSNNVAHSIAYSAQKPVRRR